MSTALGCALVFAVAAVVNWWAVAVGHRRAVVIAKPLALAALVGVALAGGAASHTAGGWSRLILVGSLAVAITPPRLLTRWRSHWAALG